MLNQFSRTELCFGRDGIVFLLQFVWGCGIMKKRKLTVK